MLRFFEHACAHFPLVRLLPRGHLVPRAPALYLMLSRPNAFHGCAGNPGCRTALSSSVWFNPSVSNSRRSGTRRSGTLVVGMMTACSVLFGCASDGTGSSPAAPAPKFVSDTTVSGIDHSYSGDFEFFVGGGVAAFDCDDDGRADLFFAGGTDPAALYRNESPIGGALRFAEVPSPVTDLTAVTGAYPLDLDSDGHVDLAVLRRGGNVLLRGLGDCDFEDANEKFG